MHTTFYCVYIMQSSSRRALYLGVTRDLEKRVREHQHGAVEGFTNTYCAQRLVYFERFTRVRAAIAREKQLKGWRREKKNRLVETVNPQWRDLSAEWGKPLERPAWAVRDL